MVPHYNLHARLTMSKLHLLILRGLSGWFGFEIEYFFVYESLDYCCVYVKQNISLLHNIFRILRVIMIIE